MSPRDDQVETRRVVWENRWQQGSDSSFPWHMTEMPEDLPRLLDERALSGHAALDIGCGGGVATAYLSDHVRLAVGLDIAFAAVSQARKLALDRGCQAAFLVADASALPFRSDAFGLVFDRGCLQNLPQAAWSGYFPGMARILHPGGALQLYCSKGSATTAPLLSWRGLRTRLAALTRLRRTRGPGPQFLSRALIETLAHGSLDALTLEDREFRMRNGNRRALVYGVFMSPEAE